MTTTVQRKWMTEKGKDWEVPAWVDKLVDQGKLEDCSWVNDTVAFFRIVESGPDGEDDTLYVSVDHVDPGEREMGAEAKRFCVQYWGSFENAIDPSDDDAAVKHYLKDHWEIEA